MEGLLQGCEGVSVYLDDILVTGANTEEHLRNLEAVLERLEAAGLKLKRSKCILCFPGWNTLVMALMKTGYTLGASH